MPKTLLSLFVLTFAACTPAPSTTPTPVATVGLAVTNNRPEEMTILIAGRREQVGGMVSRVLSVKRSALSADGCAVIRVQTIARSEEWQGTHCFSRPTPTLLISTTLASSYIIP